MNNEQTAEILQDIFQHTVNSVCAGPVTLANLPKKSRDRCVMIGADKASMTMTATVDAAWPDVAVSGMVVMRYGYTVPAGRIHIIEVAHPISDAMSGVAAMLITETLRGLAADDLVLALISGGRSALMALPTPGSTLVDRQTITRALLHNGTSIKKMNLVRRHLSAVKGGKLTTMAQPTRIVSLIISGVSGDGPTDVVSGLTAADNSAPCDALRVLQRYGIAIPKPVSERLNQPVDPVENAMTDEVRLIATPAMALATAGLATRQHRLTLLILGDAIENENREMTVVMAGMARSAEQYGYPILGPAVLLSGGGATVTINHILPGKGGHNTELLLSLVCASQGEYDIWTMAGDSNDIDGTEGTANAIVFPDTLACGKLNGLNAVQYLDGHDSYCYFHALNDLLITDPMSTNVNDIRAILTT